MPVFARAIHFTSPESGEVCWQFELRDVQIDIILQFVTLSAK